jgi:glycosyltransferase involved in cell wall biosynthesis
MKCSICIATRDHAPFLDATLASILRQQPPFAWEVIVVNDGANDNTAEILQKYPNVRVLDLPRRPGFAPGKARNLAMQTACGDVILQQSDDVLHVAANTIEMLVRKLQRGEFVIATVYDYDFSTGAIVERYTPSVLANNIKRPLFFLGAHWREDVYKIGGYDPDFDTVVGCDDDWFGECLIHGLGLKPRYVPVLGIHQHHARPGYSCADGYALWAAKRKAGKFRSADSPWPYAPGMGLQQKSP